MQLEGQNKISFIPMEGWLQLKWHWKSGLKYLQVDRLRGGSNLRPNLEIKLAKFENPSVVEDTSGL